MISLMKPMLVVAVLGAACTTATAPAETGMSFDGDWRAELDSPGGALPFGLQIQGERAWLLNGEEKAPVGRVEIRREQVILHIDWYDARIEAHRVAPDALAGRWIKTTPDGHSELPFSAERGQAPRFASSAPPTGDTTGVWKVTFADDNGTEPARATFKQEGAVVRGTFETPTGDYRFLEGSLDGSQLRLSTFDGAHAFLFSATLNGESLRGDFWSRDSYHATWTATRVASAEEAPLPDPTGLSKVTSEDGRFRFAFENLDGEVVRHDDKKFAGKVVLIDIFGSWCPNCADLTPLHSSWHADHHSEGLEIVGLAFEFGKPERNRAVLKRYAAHHGVQHEILLAGPNDKKIASERLVDLDKVVAYPTLVFVDRKGRVRHVHAGFSGPATPSHEHMVNSLESVLKRLLAEAN